MLIHEKTRFFPNSGTLKGSSRLFKSSQGVPARSADPGRQRCSRGLRAMFAAVFALKTNEKSTFWLLVPTRCLKKACKTNEKSTFLLLGPGATILGTKKVPLKPILFQHFGFGGVLGVSWGRLGPSWGVLGSSWVRLGGVLGRLGGILGASCFVLGASCV